MKKKIIGLLFCLVFLFPNFVLADGGVPCVIPENADEIKINYENLSNSILNDWLLEEVHIGCGGSISAIYLLPEYSSENTKYKVELESGYPLLMDDPFFTDEFIKNRNINVSASVASIKSNKVFNEIESKFLNKNISFLYNTKTFYIFAYNEFESCFGRFEIRTDKEDILFFNIPNNLEIDSIPIIKLSRQYVDEYLKNLSSSCKIKMATESLCGKTDVYTSSVIDYRGEIPYQYTAKIDTEGKECPSTIEVLMNKDWQPFSFKTNYETFKGESNDFTSILVAIIVVTIIIIAFIFYKFRKKK